MSRNWKSLFPVTGSSPAVNREVSNSLSAQHCRPPSWNWLPGSWVGQWTPGTSPASSPPAQVGQVEWLVTLTSHWLCGPILSCPVPNSSKAIFLGQSFLSRNYGAAVTLEIQLKCRLLIPVSAQDNASCLPFWGDKQLCTESAHSHLQNAPLLGLNIRGPFEPHTAQTPAKPIPM